MQYNLENDDDTFRPLNPFVKRECFTFLSWFQDPASMNSDDKELPRSIGNLKNLETLVISGCSSLDELPSEVEWMESLKVLKADKIWKYQLDSATHKTNFWQAPLCSWVSKPRTFVNVSLPHLPQSLVSLSLVDCNLLEDAFPLEFGNLVLLQKLDLSKNPMRSLPEGIRRLSSLQTLSFESCHLLQSLIGLPDVKELYVNYCKSLKAVTHLSTKFKVEYLGIADYCEKLAEVHGYFKIEPIGELCEEFLEALGFFRLQMMANMHVNFFDGISTFYPEKYPIQLLYEFGIFSTSILAKELPEWFETRSTGSSISFVVPSQLQGLNISFLYAKPNSKNEESDWFPLPFFVSITNKTKDLRWIYNPTCFGIPEAEEILWLSHWSFRNELECGDEVDVSVVIGNGFQVMECGINFIYQELGEDIQNSYLSWKEVIGGDLRAYRLSTGEYLLCRATFTRNNEAEQISERANWSTTSWGKRLFEEDSVNFTGTLFFFKNITLFL
nr:TMV resistance protein N-like [Ipomoea batatas]